ncbi:MAG: type II toxin-antitoxin system HicA family toxin [archaeon YNP-WB-062]|jgi:predicted RNA binding protein YcfA (HicA-like mRNA interferase family)|nr:type II toxin-antitoxin system HicA family toxin [Candidatus Culexarchaeum yellowstonense]
MSKLPVVSGREVIKYLTKKGFVVSRQKGSHVVLKSQDGRRVTVPLHEELDRGTLLEILAEAGISKEEFLREWYKR